MGLRFKCLVSIAICYFLPVFCLYADTASNVLTPGARLLLGQERGEDFVIADNDQPVAKFLPASANQSVRQAAPSTTRQVHPAVLPKPKQHALVRHPNYSRKTKSLARRHAVAHQPRLTAKTKSQARYHAKHQVRHPQIRHQLAVNHSKRSRSRVACSTHRNAKTRLLGYHATIKRSHLALMNHRRRKIEV